MPEVGTLVAIGRDVSPREVTTRIDGTWTSPVSVTGTVEAKPHIRPLTDQLWFTIDADDESNGWGWGTGSRTKDGGATWAATPDPLGGATGGIVDVNISPDGRVWCITHDTDSALIVTKIWWSDDDGDTWTLSRTSGNGTSQISVAWRVMCHPTDSNIIAVQGFFAQGASTDGYIIYTLDRGDTWPSNLSGSVEKGQSGVLYLYDAIITSSSRIFASGPFIVGFPPHARVFYSDDYGVSWTQVFNKTNGIKARVFGIFLSEDETSVGVIDFNTGTTNPRLYLSTDSGDNFSLVALDTELDNISGALESDASSTDTIYLGTKNEKIWQLTPVSADGVWTQIDSGFPHSSTETQFLGVIPGTITSNTYTSMSDAGIVFSGNSVDISVNIPPTPDPEDTIIEFNPFSAAFRGTPRTHKLIVWTNVRS